MVDSASLRILWDLLLRAHVLPLWGAVVTRILPMKSVWECVRNTPDFPEALGELSLMGRARRKTFPAQNASMLRGVT